MARLASVLAACVLLAGCAVAAPQAERARAEKLAHDLRVMGIRVDARDLSPQEVGRVNALLHSDHTLSERRGLIRSTLGGRHSLRGVLLGS